MRKAIAARMTEAKQSIPHYRLGAEIELDALLALRKQLLEQNPQRKASLNDFFVKASAQALMATPAVNVQWAEKEIHQYASADISVVTAVEGGLSTPIVRNAESKTVWEIAEEVKQLAARAAKNALKIGEILGGTFSISNLGMYGVEQFDAVINPPQCAMLAIGAAKQKVVVTPNRETKIAAVLRVTLSLDHRAIDGATGAVFLSNFRKILEQPESLRPSESN